MNQWEIVQNDFEKLKCTSYKLFSVLVSYIEGKHRIRLKKISWFPCKPTKILCINQNYLMLNDYKKKYLFFHTNYKNKNITAL